MKLDELTEAQRNEVINLAFALKRKINELGITEYMDITGVEVNRGGRCFLSPMTEEEKNEWG